MPEFPDLHDRLFKELFSHAEAIKDFFSVYSVSSVRDIMVALAEKWLEQEKKEGLIQSIKVGLEFKFGNEGFAKYRAHAFIIDKLSATTQTRMSQLYSNNMSIILEPEPNHELCKLFHAIPPRNRPDGTNSRGF